MRIRGRRCSHRTACGSLGHSLDHTSCKWRLPACCKSGISSPQPSPHTSSSSTRMLGGWVLSQLVAEEETASAAAWGHQAVPVEIEQAAVRWVAGSGSVSGRYRYVELEGGGGATGGRCLSLTGD